ncbi:MAG: chemotaxis protein MotB [Verrucomicrobia bacterium]|nr:chemotaxis protein MotB [Verrucomicrobiota bacterium]
MAEPSPSPEPAASLSTSAAKTATQAAASGAAKVVAWKTVTLATAAALGLGGGGYYMNRDMSARAQLTEAEQKASALEDRAKKSELATEDLRAQLDQSKAEAQKAAALSLQLEQARAQLSKTQDVADAEKKALEKKLADQQLQLEKLKATAGVSGEDAKLEEELKKKLADKDVLISRLKDQLKVTVASEILFPSGSAELSPEGVDVLRKVAAAINKSQDEVRVEGHTDNVPIAPVLAQYYPTNWELSTARAAVAVRTLEATGMVPASRLSAVGFGDSRPLAPNDNSEGQAKNRRVEIVFTPVRSVK